MLLRCSHHVEEQFGELVQFLVAEPVFVRKPADEIRLIQQRVDVDVQFLGQLRLGRRPYLLREADCLISPILAIRAAISSPILLISRKI